MDASPFSLSTAQRFRVALPDTLVTFRSPAGNSPGSTVRTSS